MYLFFKLNTGFADKECRLCRNGTSCSFSDLYDQINCLYFFSNIAIIRSTGGFRPVS
tara:strand:- start:1485 stop:1655 length:171 start_codon:yes stop_codon:yes gene_type:complete